MTTNATYSSKFVANIMQELGDDTVLVVDEAHYIKNPKALVVDFFASPWKIGFLKRLLKIPCPYFELYKFGTRVRETWPK